MANEKLTKKQKFEMLKGLVAENAMLVEFIDHEIELLEKKKSNGNAKKNDKSELYEELVYNALMEIGEPVTPTELIAKAGLVELKNPETDIVTPQKVSPILRKMEKAGRVKIRSEKKKTYFYPAELNLEELEDKPVEE